MENSIQTESQQYEHNQLLDTYNDIHWLKKYGVSSDELKATDGIDIQDKIIRANSNNKSLVS